MAKKLTKSNKTLDKNTLDRWYKGTSREENLVDKLVEFFNLWQNQHEKSEDNSKPIKEHQLYIFGPSFNFIFKWLVPREDLEFVAKFVRVKLKKNQKNLFLELEEYKIELEEAPPEE